MSTLREDIKKLNNGETITRTFPCGNVVSITARKILTRTYGYVISSTDPSYFVTDDPSQQNQTWPMYDSKTFVFFIEVDALEGLLMLVRALVINNRKLNRL